MRRRILWPRLRPNLQLRKWYGWINGAFPNRVGTLHISGTSDTNVVLAQCHHVTGECKCDAGWTGADCRTACPTGMWGVGCSNQCECSNGAQCDAVTGKISHLASVVACKTMILGECTCPPGLMGKKCDQDCPPGLFGANCVQHCLCLNNGTCDRKTGECSCQPGWIGPACEFLCPFGYYGLGCSRKCDCRNGAACHSVTGQVRILPFHMIHSSTWRPF